MRRTIKRTVRGDLSQKFLIQATGNDRLQVKFIITHDRPQTSSHIAIGVLASQHAQVVVDATITIEPSASDTKAWLEIRTIICDQATVTASPNLEIHNNAVQAGHALTTKRISDEELFYLMSRGLPRSEAENLITQAAIAPFRKGIIVK